MVYVRHLLMALLICAMFAGHLALWTMVINRLHARGWPRRLIKAIDKVIYLLVLGVPALVVYLQWLAPPTQLELFNSTWLGELATLYVFACLLAGTYVAVVWLASRLIRRRLLSLVSNETNVKHVADELGFRPTHGWPTRCAAAVPGNQIFKLHVNVKTLRLPTLPENLDGLSIVHLSDVHMCGRITRPFFDYVVDRANELDADLVCITGDIVEKVPCLPWLVPTLGRLTARHGKFFVLGNHDKRLPDVATARALLVGTGLVDLGGRSVLHEVRGIPLLLAGNELPWFGPLPDLSKHTASGGTSRPFRILLSHSPDQLGWARRQRFDLMLAGHCHGGQICVPWIGPLVSPSYYGVKYAGGLFHEPPTLMHVSRGVSGLEPLRFNCPPELTKLVLVKG